MFSILLKALLACATFFEARTLFNVNKHLKTSLCLFYVSSTNKTENNSTKKQTNNKNMFLKNDFTT